MTTSYTCPICSSPLEVRLTGPGIDPTEGGHYCPGCKAILSHCIYLSAWVRRRKVEFGICREPSCRLGVDCHGGKLVKIPASESTLSLRHEWDDQYVAVDTNGADFIRESWNNFKPYIVKV